MLAGVVARPTRRSTSSSGISADRLALPVSVKVRAVGSENCRVIVVSGSSRGGNCDVRWRVMTTVSRSAAEAVAEAREHLGGHLDDLVHLLPGDLYL